MTKLIVHIYDINKGRYETVETEKTVEMPFDTLITSYSPDRQYHYKMYSRQENMTLFKELVIADLEKISIDKKVEYDKTLEKLRRAQNESGWIK